jgi:protein-L-isoaspartate O-methyltransferase
MMIEVREKERLVQAIEQSLRRALAPQVRNAFLQVPRHLFVQEYYQQQGKSLNWDLV